MSSIAIAGGSSGRTVLTANQTYFIRVTGSDSNSGTLASPWATPQHAMNFTSLNVDGGGFRITFDIGAGSFAGINMLNIIGCSVLYVVGAGSASTTITSGSNGDCFSFFAPISYAFNFNMVTLQATTAGSAGLRAAVPGLFEANSPGFAPADDIVYDINGGSFAIRAIAAGVEFFDNSAITVKATAGWATLYQATQGGFIGVFATYTFSGTPTFTGPIFAVDSNSFIDAGISFSGAITGTAFSVSNESGIDTFGVTLPGTGGSCDPSSSYNGGVFPMTVSALNSTFAASSYPGSRMAVTDAKPGGNGDTAVGGGTASVGVYSDGSHWLLTSDVGPASWTPTDASGAGLSFTSVSANYFKAGNMVFAYATLTYPATADASAAKIGSLPVAVPNQTYANSPAVLAGVTIVGGGEIVAIPSSTTAAMKTFAGAAITNATLTGQTVDFLLVYPGT